MLEIRPSCEACDRPLPPDATSARICSYECTFCAECVERVLANVCPNCGGGFAPRPIRPRTDYGHGTGLGNHPPTGRRIFRPVAQSDHAPLRERLSAVAPEKR